MYRSLFPKHQETPRTMRVRVVSSTEAHTVVKSLDIPVVGQFGFKLNFRNLLHSKIDYSQLLHSTAPLEDKFFEQVGKT
jgi:hypothetical protein